MKKIIIRYIAFGLGLMINSFGIALITKAGLGTSPISSVPYVLSLGLPFLSFGMWTFLINTGFIVLQILLLRKNFQPFQFLQIAVNVVFSALIDLAMSVLHFLNPASLPFQLAVLVAGCAVLGFGVALEVAPGVIMVPGEGIVSAISRVFHKPFGLVKNLFDLSLMLSAAVLSLFFFHGFHGIGIGTVIGAILVGRFVHLSDQHVSLIQKVHQLALDEPADPETEADDEILAGAEF